LACVKTAYRHVWQPVTKYATCYKTLSMQYTRVQAARHLVVFVQLFPPTAEMGKACGTYGGQENCMESFVGGS